MAEKEKQKAPRTLINLRGSAFHVSAKQIVGEIPEGQSEEGGATVIWPHDSSLNLTGEAAEFFLEYPGIVDSEKYVKPGAASAELKKENSDLKKHVASLEKEIEELKRKKK